jgi:processive 1,2-diacylglycerol beta-glucosyltransferase
MSRRILILTAGFGEGHNAAARALAAAFDRTAGPDTARVVDVFALASPRINALARRGYLGLINRAPKIWSTFYDAVDRHNLVERGLWFFHRETRILADLIARERPVAICSTYPVCAFLLEKIARDGGPSVPHYNVVTDSISIHSLWWRAGARGWFLPNDDSAEILLRAGLPADQVHVSGFPVPTFFSENILRLSPPDLGAGATPRVLHIINSGTLHAAATARALLTETNWEITCAVGRDEVLRRQLEKLAAGRAQPARILGWTDQIPHLLMTHHAVVSKAGGATTQEAIAALCPMIVSQVVPGQEEGNYELLRRHGAGTYADTPGAVIIALTAAFADAGRVWRDWRAALKPLARPDAADDIARHVLDAVAPQLSTPFNAAAPLSTP